MSIFGYFEIGLLLLAWGILREVMHRTKINGRIMPWDKPAIMISSVLITGALCLLARNLIVNFFNWFVQ
jgi:hypothetical protein